MQPIYFVYLFCGVPLLQPRRCHTEILSLKGNIMKKFLLIVLYIMLIFAFCVFYLSFNMESIVKNVVNKYGSQITGTEVSLDGFKLAPLDGKVKLTGIRVANPKGYQEPYILNIGSIYAKLDIKSVLNPVIVVEQIRITEPVVSYELKDITNSNVSEILANINKNTASTDTTSGSATNEQAKTDTSAQAKSESGSNKKVIINLLDVTGGKINIGASFSEKGATMTVPLPDIQLKDIGRENGKKGKSITETTSYLLKKIFDTAYDTIVKQGLSGLKNLVEDGAKSLEGAAQNLQKTAKDLFQGIF